MGFWDKLKKITGSVFGTAISEEDEAFFEDLEEMLIAINASYGGPNTAAALVGTKGWTKLAVPAVLIGVYGIVVGNPLGVLIGNLFL